MSDLRCHRDLIVWQKSMDLAYQIYQLSSSFPKSETYGLTSQLRRAASSIPANIAEGSARATAKDYAHFLSISRGSLMETETFMLLAARIGYFRQEEATSIMDLITEIGKMLTTMRNKLGVQP